MVGEWVWGAHLALLRAVSVSACRADLSPDSAKNPCVVPENQIRIKGLERSLCKERVLAPFPPPAPCMAQEPPGVAAAPGVAQISPQKEKLP